MQPESHTYTDTLAQGEASHRACVHKWHMADIEHAYVCACGCHVPADEYTAKCAANRKATLPVSL